MTDDPRMTKEELDVFYRRRRAKNWVFLVILGGLAALFFAITILKMS